jgi:glycerol uptake facilitator-like aquaporin
VDTTSLWTVFGSEVLGTGILLLVVGIGASLGGPTGYAINPARDLSPRIAHALQPIRGRATATGATRGCRSSARSSAPSAPDPCRT